MPQFGQPRLANQSAVRMRFWVANQAKSLTLGGAQTFHLVHGGVGHSQELRFVGRSCGVVPIRRVLLDNVIFSVVNEVEFVDEHPEREGTL